MEEFLIRPFKIYLSILLVLALFGLKEGRLESLSFSGNREIASDCVDAVGAIIRREVPQDVEVKLSQKEEWALKHYRFKNNIWNKILNPREFDSFDENEYFRLLEIYKDERQSPDLLKMSPLKIEQKLALIEAIQMRFSSFHNLPTIQDEIENLNSFKLKKLAKLLKKFNLSKKLTRENLEEFSSDFFLIIKGPPVSLLDYLILNKSERMNQRMFRVLQEDMLLRGLKGTLERIPEEIDETAMEKARLYIKRVMKYKVWRYLVMPYDLPWVEQVKVSDELLEKILNDGLDAHQSELIVELKNQNAIDHYERFRKVYRPVAFGVGFYYYYTKYQKTLVSEEDKNDEEAKKQFLNDFKKLSEAIGSGNAKVKTEDEIKEEQFQRVIKSFKDRYHEDPTPQEYQELRKKIFGS